MKKIIIQTGQTKKTQKAWVKSYVGASKTQCSGIWEDKHWHIFSTEIGKIMMQRRKKCAVIPYASPPTVNRALSWHMISVQEASSKILHMKTHISRPHPFSSLFWITPCLTRHKVKTYKHHTITKREHVIWTTMLPRSALPCGLASIISFCARTSCMQELPHVLLLLLLLITVKDQLSSICTHSPIFPSESHPASIC